jgi:hypothetical protein
MKAKRGQLNGNHILTVGYILPKLLNVKWTSKHPKHMAMRCRRQGLVNIERSVEIRQECMTGPADNIRQGYITIQIRQGTLGGTIVSLACIHVLIGIVAHRK